jgi:superfamily II DNA or RNA helicase
LPELQTNNYRYFKGFNNAKETVRMINEEKRKIQEEAIQALRDNNFNGIVILPTGAGKTFVLIEALRELYQEGMSVLYTCDSQRLRDSDFNKELVKWGAEEYVDKIEKQCYATAYKYEGKHYNILLADEGDYGLTPEYSKTFFNNTFDYIIFVSATLEKNKRSLARKIAPIVYERKIKEIEDKSVINKSQFWFVPFRLNEKENKKYEQFNERFHTLLQQPDDAKRKEKLKFLTLQRSHFLAGLESSLYICRRLMKEIYEKDDKSKILIFSNLTEQADKLCKYSYHAKNVEEGNLDKFNEGDVQALAVCGKVDRGINLNGVNNIIMEYTTRSETKAIQKLGRGKRLGVDDILNVYFLVPYFVKSWAKNMPMPTIVLSKIHEACKDLGIENAKTYIVK